MLDFTIDSTVTRIRISPVEEDEGEFSRLLTIETADGPFRLELTAEDGASLEIVDDEA